MSKTVNLDAVIGMLRRAEKFKSLPSPQQAALRAQVTRALKGTDDPQLVGALRKIQDVVGVAPARSVDRMTAADLLEEYDAHYSSYDAPRRAAFKAKVSRLANFAKTNGDSATEETLTELAGRIVEEEQAAQRDLIRRLTDQLS